MVSSLNDVIAAIATTLGEGGISVIRISGSNAIETADKGFRGKQKLTSCQTQTAHFGNFVDSNGEILDEVVATLFRAPHSYTVEDVVEISCHGGVYVTKKILQSIISHGARNAEPGEFTKRAFLNGRIDLAQAEAVADLIHARSEGAHRASIKLLGGSLSAIVKRIREDLLRVCGLLELELDFAEEGIELAKGPEIIEEINAALLVIESIQKSYADGRMIRDGVKVALVGRPNVGKSSILNALLREERAIVTNIPGTTRDSISEELIINGIVFNLIDTAGLRDSDSIVEIEGIKRTIKEVVSADIVLLVIDISNEMDIDNTGVLDEVKRLLDGEGTELITVYNKADLVPMERYHLRPATQPHIIVSAKTGYGMEGIGKKLSEFSAGWCRSYNQDGPVLTNSRHNEALKKAIAHLISAKHLISIGAGNEVVSLEMNASVRIMSEIIGVISTEDLLNSIFESFCIGK